MALEHAILVSLSERAGSGPRPHPPLRQVDRLLLDRHPPADLPRARPHGDRRLGRLDAGRAAGPPGQEGVRRHRRRSARAPPLARRAAGPRAVPVRPRREAARRVVRRPRGRCSSEVAALRAEHATRLALYEQMEQRDYPDPTALTGADLDQYLVLRGGVLMEQFWMSGSREYLDAHEATTRPTRGHLMNDHYPHLLAPLEVRGGTLRNRVVMGSMHTGLEDRPWHVPQLAAYFAERARGGVGLIVTGGYSPNVPRLAAALRLADDDASAGRARTAGHRRGARRGRRDRPAAAARRPLRLHAVLGVGVRDQVADHAVQGARDVDRRASSRPSSDFARGRGSRRGRATTASRSWAPRATCSTSSSSARTNQRDDAWGGTRREAHALPRRDRAPVREAVGEDFIVMYRMSLLDLVPDGQTWDETVELAPRRRGRPARRSSTPASAGTRRACPRSSPRCRAAPGPGPRSGSARRSASRSARPTGSTPPRSPRTSSPTASADLVSMARPFLADPRLRRQGRRRPRRRDQHLHRLQPGLPRPHLRRPSAPPAWSTRAPATRPSSSCCRCRAPARRASRSSAAVRPGSPPPLTAAERGHHGHAVRGRRRARRPVPARPADPRQGGVRRDAALLPPPLRGARRRRTPRDRARHSDDLLGFDEVVVATGVEPRPGRPSTGQRLTRRSCRTPTCWPAGSRSADASP